MASATPTGNDPNAVYSLGRNARESHRLQRQADELFAQSAALVDRTTLGPGGSAIDVGCGPRGILDLLAQRVGSGGRVVGVDADPNHVAMATQMAADRHLDWISVVRDDARHTSLPSSSFDVVHGRTILITVPEPGELVVEMARLAKPGGWVIGLEPDVEPSICYPGHPAYDRLGDMFPVVFSRNGADWRIGRRVAELYRAADLVDIQVETRAEVYPKDHTRRTIRVDLLRSMRPFIVELGLASESELEVLFDKALAHLDDPDVIVMPSVNFLVSGRKRDGSNSTRPRMGHAAAPGPGSISTSPARIDSPQFEQRSSTWLMWPQARCR
jgi:ubiquinone/menaquinone biosynthesis C-methylase UbiE